ncbi:hypothetical protein BGZ76_004912 [Entomortierella beljakovae]|nr:hypothetical protein BGZ76_004912 [Entomortierella beljakovae]
MMTFNLDLEGNSALLASNNLKYRIAYFGIHFAGTSSRGILAYASADWTPEYPDWGNEKSNMPFEVIPVLTIVHPNRKELVLAENVAIDIFLAKQFDLHGRNSWEEALINSFYSSYNTMFFHENEQLGKWARIHEAHLANNQHNAHYVGDRDHDSIGCKKIFGKERVTTIVNRTKTPGLIKVRKNVESKASYQTWITSEEYQKLDTNLASLVNKHHPELVK